MSIAEGWAVKNIKLYGNTAIPRELIETLGSVETTERLISAAVGKKISVRETKKGCFLAEYG